MTPSQLAGEEISIDLFRISSVACGFAHAHVNALLCEKFISEMLSWMLSCCHVVMCQCVVMYYSYLHVGDWVVVVWCDDARCVRAR